MSKRIGVNCFLQASPASQTQGQWKDADQLSQGYKDPEFYVEIAKLCEQGFFDALFFADVHGVYDIYQGSAAAGVRAAVQFPGNDPTTLPALLARETKHLGFVCTYSTAYYTPFHTAKLFSTLDHFTRGRIGWNIVTGYLESAYKNGLGVHLPHDERYERAEEYMEVVYQLWERSWDDDAVVRNAATSTHTDPSKVYQINHKGKYFDVAGPHMCEPSLQRTPVLVQAGGSPRGINFAGRHSEAIYGAHTSAATAGHFIRKVREAAAKEGRDPSTVKIYSGISTVVGETEAEAKAKYERYAENASVDGALALFGGWTGIDLAGLKASDKMAAFESQGMQQLAAMFGAVDGQREWTFGEVCEFMKLSSVLPVLVGTPEQVADELEAWIDESDADGFNFLPIQHPGDLKDFVEMVVPEMQKRGRMRLAYEGSTLRENLYGAGQRRLLHDHPAHKLISPFKREPILS